MQVKAADYSSSSKRLDNEASKASPSQADRVSCICALLFFGIPLPAGNAYRSGLLLLSSEGSCPRYILKQCKGLRLALTVCQDAEAVQTRLSIEDKLLLESSQPWVHVPSRLILPSGGRSFEVKVLALATSRLVPERGRRPHHLTFWTRCSPLQRAGAVPSDQTKRVPSTVCRWTAAVWRKGCTLQRSQPRTAQLPGGGRCSGSL